MGGRIRQLLLQGLQRAPQYIGFGGAELSRQALQPTTVRWVEINLDRFGNAPWLAFMRRFHELMIW